MKSRDLNMVSGPDCGRGEKDGPLKLTAEFNEGSVMGDSKDDRGARPKDGCVWFRFSLESLPNQEETFPEKLLETVSHFCTKYGETYKTWFLLILVLNSRIYRASQTTAQSDSVSSEKCF